MAVDLPAAPELPLLSRETILQRVPELLVQVHSNGQLSLECDGGATTCGRHGLAILNLFSRPHSFVDGLQRLGEQARSPRDLAELGNTIRHLHTMGALHEHLSGQVNLSRQPGGYSSPSGHTRMLNDKRRVTAYLAAIAKIVRPGDVVLDIGTGTGILALAAARAGARRVYAIESTHIADAARQLAAANGMADRITVVQGWSSAVELPERADVLLMSELMGRDLFGERALSATSDARRRFLHAGSRYIPSVVRLYALLLEAPIPIQAQMTFSQAAVSNWSEWYGFSFEALHEAAGQGSQKRFLDPATVREWRRLADPVLLRTIDLSEDPVSCDVPPSGARTTCSGSLGAVLLYFEADLGPGLTHSVHPDSAVDNCWICPLWLLSEPVAVQSGDQIVIHVTHPGRTLDSELRVELAAQPWSPA